MKSKTCAFYTLGCKVNQYETDAIAGVFKEKGYSIVEFDSIADVYVINTCTVTAMSDKKARQIIRRANKLNPEAKIIVTGCYAQKSAEEVRKIPGVSLVIGNAEKGKLADYLENLAQSHDVLVHASDILGTREFTNLSLKETTSRTRAFIKIQEGCESFCSYCIVPYVRGPIRSRTPEEIVKEVEFLVSQGYQEVVLTGIHLGMYGIDLSKKTDLADVTARISELTSVKRIRISSIEPTEITDKLLELIKNKKNICSHLHIPLQSGSADVLKRMNRRYTSEQFSAIIDKVKTAIPKIALTTDIMVGFPGETEADFENTMRLTEKCGFSKLHVFRYSPREGTPAASFPNQVSPKIKEERSARLIELGDKLSLDYMKEFLGKTKDVLFEEKNSDGLWEGLTDNYLHVFVDTPEDLKGLIKSVDLLDFTAAGIKGILTKKIS